MAEENDWHKYLIHAKSHKAAAILASERELWLHCWDYIQDDKAVEAYIVGNPAYTGR